MNKHNIIFISGLCVPKILAKTKFVWNDSLWFDYKRTYLSSYIPSSDFDAQNKINELTKLINSLDNPIVIGQSLGAWWAANLACNKNCNLKKIILVTPLADARDIPIINVTSSLNPLNKKTYCAGPARVLVCCGKYDIICPPHLNSYNLALHFNAMTYEMNGGHLFQKDHQSTLKFMQDWIDV